MYDGGSCAMHSGIFGMGYGWIFQLIIFVAFFLVVWWLLKTNATGPALRGKENSRERPIDILKRRLASGEITKKEFESLRKEIEG